MTLDRLRGETRLLIGSPSVNLVPERELDSFLIPSVQWFAGHTKCVIRQDDNIPLVAEQRTYVLPPDFLYSSWVQISGNMLESTSVWALNSGAQTTSFTGTSGQTWMTVTSGTPSRYAMQGREMILYPPPSAAFIATNPALSWRYVSSGAAFASQGQVGLTPHGIPFFTDLDEAVIRYSAALDWLSAHLIGQPPDQVQAMQAQISELKDRVAMRLPECKRRWAQWAEDYAATARPDTSGRFVAAR